MNPSPQMTPNSDPTVSQLMSHPVVTIAPTATVRQAAELMSLKSIGAVIVAVDGKLLGILSERDVLNKVIAKGIDPEVQPISEFMTSQVLTLSPQDKPFEALHTMLYEHIRHMPVIDAQGKVVGIISIRDLMRKMMEKALLI